MSAAPQPWAAPGPPPATGKARTGWTAGRIISIIVGSLLALVGVGMLAVGIIALVADQTQRENGYLTSSQSQFTTSGVALTSENIKLYDVSSDILGKVLIRATSANARPLFLGIGPTAQVSAYLQRYSYSTVNDITNSNSAVLNHPGAVTRVTPPPYQMNIWQAQVSGTGTQSLTWELQNGSWTAVAMNRDGTPALTISAELGVELPWLTGVGIGFLIAGLVILIGAAFLIIIPIRRAVRKPAVAAGTPGGVWTPPGTPGPGQTQGQMPPPGGAGTYPPGPTTGGYPPPTGGYPPPPPGSTEPPPPSGKTL